MLDDLDKQLLYLLYKDARQSSEVLAKQIHVSSATVRRRIKKMRKSGVLHTSAFADPKLLGLSLVAFIGINVESHHLDNVMQKLVNLPEITWLANTTGRYEIVSTVRFTSTEALYKFTQKQLNNVEGITNTEVLICMRVTKAHYLPNASLFRL